MYKLHFIINSEIGLMPTWNIIINTINIARLYIYLFITFSSIFTTHANGLRGTYLVLYKKTISLHKEQQQKQSN